MTVKRKLVAKNGNGLAPLLGEYAGEFGRLNDRITMVAQVFNESVNEMRQDLRKLDDRIHGLLEEGIISNMNMRITKIEEQTSLLPSRTSAIERIEVELAKIEQRVSGVMWVMAVTIGPAVAYLVTAWLVHIISSQ